MRLQQLAEQLRAELEGDPDHEVRGVAGLSTASQSDVVFIDNRSFAAEALASSAGAIIASRETLADTPAPSRNILYAANPRLAFARAARILLHNAQRHTGVDASAVVDPSASMGSEVSIGAQCVIGPN